MPLGLPDTGCKLRAQLGHHFGGAVADPLHLHIGMHGGESINRLLRICIRLRRVEDQCAGHIGTGDVGDKACGSKAKVVV